MFVKEIRNLIAAFVLISVGGLMLHLRIHPIAKDVFNVLPVISGVISVFILPFMFNNRKMCMWAYMITLISVIAGTIAMASFSIKHPPEHITVITIILQTTVSDILILIAKVPIANGILQYWKPEDASE